MERLGKMFIKGELSHGMLVRPVQSRSTKSSLRSKILSTSSSLSLLLSQSSSELSPFSSSPCLLAGSSMLESVTAETGSDLRYTIKCSSLFSTVRGLHRWEWPMPVDV